MADATTPGEFDPIFRQGVPIVGGHAVNLWATYYSPRGDKELREFAPFISKDGDIYLKDPQIAQAVATAAGWRFEKNPEARSAVLGRIVLEKGGVRLDVHVMRSVNGLSEAGPGKDGKFESSERNDLLPAGPGRHAKGKTFQPGYHRAKRTRPPG